MLVWRAATRNGITMATPTRHIRGFTLIEMLLVVTMVAVLSASVVANLHGRKDEHSLRMCARDLAATIRFAASEAKVQQAPHRVTFLEGHRSYRADIADPQAPDGYAPCKGVAGIERSLPVSVRLVAMISDDSKIDPMPSSLQFTPGGDGFSGSIQLEDRNKRMIQIEVLPKTGQVYVSE